jgi:hypothetical protein
LRRELGARKKAIGKETLRNSGGEMKGKRGTDTPKEHEASRKKGHTDSPSSKPKKLARSLTKLTAGILAKEVIKSAESAGESPADFKVLLRGLGRSLKPYGTLERFLVQQIAVNCHKRPRIFRAEQAEIKRASRDAKELELEKKSSDRERSVVLREELRSVRPIGNCLPPVWVLERTNAYSSLLDSQMKHYMEWLILIQKRRRKLNDEKG